MGVYQATLNGNIIRFKRPRAFSNLLAAWEKYTISLLWVRAAAEDGVRAALKDLTGRTK
jgi:hypothetical protein